ncbi:N-6 DNA methylase [Drancourtella massiliensis]|uniref:N-6 DNA methylase n=1 Tax=Drancourtella massiliensis TaxID=1632013 RepID=A0ABS2EKS3_9FIRM|nr:N-6 DNA methylase [Drancourtella massiliensis]
MSFLCSACRNFRLPFDEQILIYAQRPEASAVLPMKVWNEKFGRWVKRDSKGIAVFDKDSPKLRLKYYYDVLDTQEGRYRRLLRPVPLWEVPEEYQPDVRETLANAFGVDETVTGFAETILEAAKSAAEDNLADYLPDLLEGRKGSYLEEVDEYNVEVEARQLLSTSVAYMVMVRCGVDTDLYLDTEDFRNITDFNTPEMVNLFGVAASDVAEMALSEISDTVNKLRKAERKNSRTFAGKETGRYNESENREQITERSVTHESDHIQQTGRLSSSGSDRAGRTGSTPWEVRFPPSYLSEKLPVRDVSEPADKRRTEPTSERSAERGTGEDGSSDRTDESSLGRDRGTESERPDGVGTADEQHPAGSGRDRDERADLQLTGQEPQSEEERQEPTAEPQPTVAEQQTFLEELAGEESPAFSMPQEIIDHALQPGPPFEHGKYRIYSYFLQGHSNKERAEFLKQEYGMGGSLSDYLGERFYQNRNAKGYTIQWKNYETTLKWTAVAKRIEELIVVGRYMTERELAYIPEYERMILARSIYNFFYHQPETVLRPYPFGMEYHKAVEQIRPQLDDPDRVKEILSMMEEVLAGTADYDQRYPSMKQAYKDLTDYQDGAFSLFTPIPAERENMQAPPEPVPAQSREEVLAGCLNAFYQSYDWYEYQDTIEAGETQEDVLRQLQEQLADPQSVQEIYSYLISVREGMDTEDENYSEVSELIAGITDLPAMNPPYDLQVDTIVTIGTKEYSIDFISDEMVVLRDQMYPLFTEEMPREVFDRRVRENPANDHLRADRKPSEEPAEKDREEPAATQEMVQEQEEGFTGIKPEDNPFEKEPEELLEDLAPAWTQKKPAGRVRGFDPHPEIPQESRRQYQITDEHLGEGTEKEKFRANIMAIQLLKKCEEENRFATPKEQEILAGYVGWGGLSDAFDETKSSWSTEYLELKTVLTEEEYAAARQSTLTAFYTPPVVISAMYQALENMGLKSGNILEPSCGTGNFIGRKPESLSDCKVYGVEIDSISARIAQQLYQKSTIAVQGFEDADLPDSFFDVVVGNVPFGSYKVLDRKYDKYNFLIHDYFIAKSIDKTRPKGVLALITSNGISGGTMDKRDDRVRRYIAQRCDLLGAIRLPNNAFLANAGTEINTDILFFQKRETPRDLNVDLPDWVEVERLYENDYVNEQGESRHRVVSINPYFQQHPEMVLGEQEIVSGPYGPQLICKPYPDRDFKELLEQTVENLEAEITDYEVEELVEEEDHSIPADPSVANFSYTVYDGKIYYRENSRMKPVELSVTAQNRVKGMIAIRDCTRELITYQAEGYPDEEIERQQKKLNHLYDLIQRKYGLLNSRANSMAFSDDSSYPLLCSLEIVAEDGTLERKADMFTKRTIKPHETVTKVDTASEALSLSLSEKACVDMEYLCSLTGKSAREVEEELKGVIFRLPESEGMDQPRFVSEDEYLSGNVRQKLREAKRAAEISEVYRSNVEALEKVQPKDLTASEISVRLGATWIPESDIADFMFELLQTPNYSQWKIKVHFSRHTGEWNIEGKSMDRGNPRVTNTYGTNRVNAYKIIEDTLNLRDTRVFDYVEDAEGKRKPILNRKETAIAQGKQDLIKQAFQEWIWKDPKRRQRLTEDYNERFNAIRPREYDGSHLHFYGMNPEITLRKHQKDGVARIIYGGNTLLAYVVGAGKTYTMVAAAMECKRLGLCSKSMIVVPNHIIEQFAAEWLQLYPAANILVATKKDFEKKNRKKFCGRIATSDIDAVIIGHSQFEKIPLSVERQERMLQMEIDEIIEGIAEAKKIQGSRFTVKQMERAKKSLETRLKRLHDQSRKDDMITFEELGVDRLFVDEADGYKNLYLTTKMRNVGGIAQTEAQKSSDMYMKCRYLDEITGGKGVIFSTGTPVSNSMVELYTMQRYLQYGTLAEKNLQHFDAWASTFGETVTALEIAPEGNGYRLKTRFARFYNLPELMQMFREVADIQTADMLNLPVPEAEYRVVKVKPTELQEEMVEELGNRAERVRNNEVNPREDNMLKITNDGRKLALDQRLSNPLLPDDPGSKVNACVEEIYRHWEDGKEKKLTQLVFCDLSTPKTDGTFSVYNDIRDKLLARGIPPEEIAFIHDANTDVRKKELFSKVRRGAVRILMGSTFKMGAGTNVQDRIIASHDLDCPWRPRDLEQRAGRTIRQGNQNPKVEIIRYVTEGTFDAYLYQTIENKQKYISQIMTSKSPARSVEDIDEVALSYAEIKALATGNPHIKEKMDLDIQVSRLQLLKQSFLNQRYEMEDKVAKYFPEKIRQQELLIRQYEEDIQKVKAHTPTDREAFPVMQIGDHVYTEKKEAGQAIIEACKAMKSPEPVPLGTYRGLSMELSYSSVSQEFVIALHGKGTYKVPLGTDIYGNITRLDNKMNELPDNLSRCREQLETAKSQLETAKAEAQKEFPQEKELAEKVARLGELNVLLDMDKKDRVVMEEEPETEEIEPEREKAAWVR